MIRQLSDDVRVILKDRLRDARHLIRQSRHDSPSPRHFFPVPHPPFPVRGMEDLLGHAAAAFDDTLTMVETLVQSGRPAATKPDMAKGLRAYFPLGNPPRPAPRQGSRAFRRDMYRATKVVLGRLGIEGALVHEVEFTAIHAAMIRRHAELLDSAGPRTDRSTLISWVAGICAALLAECLARNPIRFADAPVGEADDSRAIRCLAAVVLTCGINTVAADETPDFDIPELAILAVDARRDRFIAASFTGDMVREFSPIFATLLAHLR